MLNICFHFPPKLDEFTTAKVKSSFSFQKFSVLYRTVIRTEKKFLLLSYGSMQSEDEIFKNDLNIYFIRILILKREKRI